jgi:hypothetical protein
MSGTTAAMIVVIEPDEVDKYQRKTPDDGGAARAPERDALTAGGRWPQHDAGTPL